MIRRAPDSIADLRERLSRKNLPGNPKSLPPNRYASGTFLTHDVTTGRSSNALGDQLIWLAPGELAGLVDRADPESLNRAGFTAGLAGLEEFIPRAEAEFGVALAKVNLGRVLQAWWWPYRAAGWGRWHTDLTYQSRGVILGEIEGPPWDEAGAAFGEFLAGICSAVFGYLAGRELPSLVLSRDPGKAVFLISTRKTIEAARCVIANRATTSVVDLINQLPARDSTS